MLKGKIDSILQLVAECKLFIAGYNDIIDSIRDWGHGLVIPNIQGTRISQLIGDSLINASTSFTNIFGNIANLYQHGNNGVAGTPDEPRDFTTRLDVELDNLRTWIIHRGGMTNFTDPPPLPPDEDTYDGMLADDGVQLGLTTILNNVNHIKTAIKTRTKKKLQNLNKIKKRLELNQYDD